MEPLRRCEFAECSRHRSIVSFSSLPLSSSLFCRSRLARCWCTRSAVHLSPRVRACAKSIFPMMICDRFAWVVPYTMPKESSRYPHPARGVAQRWEGKMNCRIACAESRFLRLPIWGFERLDRTRLRVHGWAGDSVMRWWDSGWIGEQLSRASCEIKSFRWIGHKMTEEWMFLNFVHFICIYVLETLFFLFFTRFGLYRIWGDVDYAVGKYIPAGDSQTKSWYTVYQYENSFSGEKL